MEVVRQAGFWGDDQVGEDVVMRCAAMLEEEPETRSDYTVGYVRYLARYHGLDRWLATARTTAELIQFLQGPGVPGFRTVANRCQELMRAEAELRPPRDVVERRQKQRRQGRVR